MLWCSVSEGYNAIFELKLLSLRPLKLYWQPTFRSHRHLPNELPELPWKFPSVQIRYMNNLYLADHFFLLPAPISWESFTAMVARCNTRLWDGSVKHFCPGASAFKKGFKEGENIQGSFKAFCTAQDRWMRRVKMARTRPLSHLHVSSVSMYSSPYPSLGILWAILILQKWPYFIKLREKTLLQWSRKAKSNTM